MDKIKKYKQIAHQLISETAEIPATDPQTEALLLVDSANGHYMLMSDGWEEAERHYGPVVHIQIKKDGKVWLRYDGTDLEIGLALLQKGVLASDLVLAFHSPRMRVYTGYATA